MIHIPVKQQASRLPVDAYLGHKTYKSRQLVARRVNGLLCFFPACLFLDNSTEPVHHALIATITTRYAVQDAWAHKQYLDQWLEGKTPLAQDTESTSHVQVDDKKYQQKLQLVKYSHVQVGSDKRKPYYKCKGVMPLCRVLYVCMLIPYMCFICVGVHNNRHCPACHTFPKEIIHFILHTHTLLNTRAIGTTWGTLLLLYNVYTTLANLTVQHLTR